MSKESTAGRTVRVAAVCIGTGGDRDTKIKQAIEYIQVSGENHVDIAVSMR